MAEMCRWSLQAHPGYAEAHCNLGVIHKEEGRLEEAIASYERALAAAPEFNIVRNNLAVALTELGTRVKLSGEHVLFSAGVKRGATAFWPLVCMQHCMKTSFKQCHQ